MKDEDGSKEQLVNESVQVRQRIAELQTSEAKRKWAEETIQWRRIWLPTAGMFVLLCILVWLTEILDLPHLSLGAPRTSINWQEAIVETLMIGIVGLFTVSRLIHDITERQRAEEALRESEERLRAFAEALPDLAFILDENGRHVEVLTAQEHLLRVEAAKMKGCSLHEVLPEEAADSILAAVRRTIETGKPQTLEYELDVPIGRVWFEGRAAPMRGTSGETRTVVWVSRDVTQRKRAEEDLDRIFNLSLDMLCISGFDGYAKRLNPAFEKTLGYTNEEILAKPFLDFVHPEDRAATIAKLQELATGTPTVYFEQRCRCKDGSYKWLAWANTPVVEEGLMYAVARDVTERVRAEAERERLLAAEREQRTLAETLAEVALALTSQSSREAVLDEILRQTKRIVPHTTANIALLEGDALRVVRWQGYEAPGDKEAIANLVQPLADFPLDAEVVRSREPLIIADTSQDPHWLVLDEAPWIRSHLSMPICLRNRVLGLLRLDGDAPGEFSTADARRLQSLANAAAIAIENARLVEGLEAEVAARTAEIRAEQEKSEAILRSVGDAIAVINFEMQVQYTNAAFTALTGYTAAEATGFQANSLIGERLSVPAQQSLELALAQGEAWQGEATIQRKDGRTYDAAMVVAPMRDADGNLTGYVASHQDISQRKNLDRARSRFVTNVSHELRTPVASMKLYAHLLQMGRQPEKIQHYAQVLEEQADRLAELVQDILEMTELDSGQAVTTWRPISLPTIIGDTVTRYQSRAEASGLTLVAMPTPPNSPTVKGDQCRLAQALGELVENAITFTPAGGKVTVEVGTAEKDEQCWVIIAVHDTGPGISPEEQERVFDRFYRGRLAESGHVPGTGLGLSVAQEIMHAHGGRVTVESRAGQGSTFRV